MTLPAIEQWRSFVVCRPVGELDAMSAPTLRQALAEAASFNSHVIVDLVGVTFMDSSGLGVLAGAVHRVRTNDCVVVLCAPTPSVGRALTVVGLRRIVDVVESFEEARSLLDALDGHLSVPEARHSQEPREASDQGEHRSSPDA